MRREHPPYRYMGQFKAFFADYEYYLTLSDKPVSVCLTERQMYILSVWNSYTPWMTRWYNTEDTSDQQLAVIAAEIENLLMCGCGVPVPSITDTINTNTYITNTSTDYITNNTTYTADGDTLDTLAPNMTYAVGTEADIDRILCFGYGMMIEAILEQGKAVKNLEADQDQDLVQQLGIAMSALAGAGGIALTVGGFAATIVAVIGGPWALLGLALGGIATGIASLFIQADTALFDDQDAIDEVLCTMRENSLGNEPTFAVFSSLLTPNLFEPDSNAEKLAEIVQPFLDSLDFYLQFMISMSELYATPLLVALPECDTCPTVDNCVGGEFSDFTLSNGMWEVTFARALYYSGSNPGWGVHASGSTRVSIRRALSPTATKVKIITFGAMGTGRLLAYPSNALVAQDDVPVDNGDGTYTYEFLTLVSPTSTLIVDMGSGVIPDAARIRLFCWNYD